MNTHKFCNPTFWQSVYSMHHNHLFLDRNRDMTTIAKSHAGEIDERVKRGITDDAR